MVKIRVRTPSGKVVTKIEEARPSFAKCASCGKPLHGIPRLIPAKMRKLPKTKRRPERPYGGYLCSECSREMFREKTRELS